MNVTISDYKNWLDNISTGDTRASSYIMDKVMKVSECHTQLTGHIDFRLLEYMQDLSVIQGLSFRITT